MRGEEDHLDVYTREFRRLKKLADAAVSQVSKERFFESSGPGDNSLATLFKHMAGNMRSRWTGFLTTDGEKPGRNRDEEFLIREDDTFSALQVRWHEAWDLVFDSLASMVEADLERTVSIRGEKLSAMQAIVRQLTHYAYHVGQIVYIAKRLSGGKWRSLSIPMGKSAAFNQAPAKYLDPAKPLDQRQDIK